MHDTNEIKEINPPNRRAPKVRKAIVRRIGIPGRPMERELECGHVVEEPNGGKARDAQWAFCPKCTEAKHG